MSNPYPTPQSWTPPPAPRKRHTVRNVLLAIVGVFVLLVILGVVLGSGTKPVSSATGPTDNVPAATATTPAPHPSPDLSSGDAAFVTAVRSALSSGGYTNSATDAQIAGVGDSLCKVLSDGGTQSAVAAMLTNRKAENNFNMTSKELVSTAHRDICPQVSLAPSYTEAEQQAITAAQGYLSDGEGFSRAGLISQLSSPDGSGFSAKLATFAADHVTVNWWHQAVISAKGYMSDGEGFSYSGLVDQLDSPDGSQFTYAQAAYAARHVGL
jgi:Host cell surface-exposed lipoprotein